MISLGGSHHSVPRHGQLHESGKRHFVGLRQDGFSNRIIRRQMYPSPRFQTSKIHEGVLQHLSEELLSGLKRHEIANSEAIISVRDFLLKAAPTSS